MLVVSKPALARAATSSASAPQSGSPSRRVPTRPFFLRMSVKPRSHARGSCPSAVPSSSPKTSSHALSPRGGATRAGTKPSISAVGGSIVGTPVLAGLISRGTTRSSASSRRRIISAAASNDAIMAASCAQTMTSRLPPTAAVFVRRSERRTAVPPLGSRTLRAARRAPAEMRRSLESRAAMSRRHKNPIVPRAPKSIPSPLNVPSAASRMPSDSAARDVAPKYVAIVAPANSAGQAKFVRSLPKGASVSSRSRVDCVNS
mmetsp:Transcript_4626/g.10040  ORF Transcript_4626/g.10040 Transcript_4626/m.10040 type:complete len:260 (-) Transcript_4626:136-915(-)